jgi:BirA family biotin operon repressor/biotin-[acetyl-CoA-carboxylase] ligase
MPLALVDDVRPLLETERFGRAMKGFEAVDSTNARAADWARQGGAEGSVVVTDYQTAGRGRHGRSWAAPKGQNLLFSVVLRPALPADRLGLVTVAAGVAVAEAVEAFVSPHRASIKWPNDILLEGRKTCGMLLESSVGLDDGASAPPVVVLGIGLNVNQTDFPEALADTATSLRLTTGRTVPRAALLARLLGRLETRYDQATGDAAGADGPGAVRQAFQERLYRLGETATLRVAGTDRRLQGTVAGIADDGGLRLDTGDGVRTVHAGEVTSRPADSDADSEAGSDSEAGPDPDRPTGA